MELPSVHAELIYPGRVGPSGEGRLEREADVVIGQTPEFKEHRPAGFDGLPLGRLGGDTASQDIGIDIVMDSQDGTDEARAGRGRAGALPAWHGDDDRWIHCRNPK